METKKYKKWTPEEDRVVIKQVQKHCDNLKLAFEESSRILEDRTTAAIAQRWYDYIRKDETKMACFAFVGKNMVIKNGKRPSRRIKKQKHKVSIWEKVKKLLNL